MLLFLTFYIYIKNLRTSKDVRILSQRCKKKNLFIEYIKFIYILIVFRYCSTSLYILNKSCVVLLIYIKGPDYKIIETEQVE